MGLPTGIVREAMNDVVCCSAIETGGRHFADVFGKPCFYLSQSRCFDHDHKMLVCHLIG